MRTVPGAISTGYHRALKTSPVAATMAKAVSGRKRPHQRLPM